MASVQPTNRHFSVGPDGNPVYDLHFASEALGMPASMGYGWANLDFGQRIGPDGRYIIERKLGWGGNSSTWLARDDVNRNFVAVKVCTGHTTELDRKNLVWESDALRAVSFEPLSPHTIRLLSDFTLPGNELTGDHLCFVTPLYRGDVSSLMAARSGKGLPLPLAKRILLHLLRGIVHAHSRSVVHADLKTDNIFIDTRLSSANVEGFLKEYPARRHEPELSHEGQIVQSAVSQHFPVISLEEAQEATYVLGDFGCAQPSRLHDARTINIIPNRPPEVWLQGEWDMPADIWAFGCLLFEIVTGETLSTWTRAKTWDLPEPNSMLYQMACKTGDNFNGHLLRQWPAAVEYFIPPSCRFKSFVPNEEVVIYNISFEACIRGAVEDMGDAEINSLAALMRRCLRLDPQARASALDLLDDLWFAE
ncbi:hypothetical protein VNI00_003770 [Paramarasmius palmivorus]|uniref:Protein kinase domain-containing protein n=1 Tax=Paramarasmius palmivorus TaxID=297713 RepID=A0AAW0DMI3_9AGAR